MAKHKSRVFLRHLRHVTWKCMSQHSMTAALLLCRTAGWDETLAQHVRELQKVRAVAAVLWQ